MANSADPDEMLHSAVFHLNLRGLPLPFQMDIKNKLVKTQLYSKTIQTTRLLFERIICMSPMFTTYFNVIYITKANVSPLSKSRGLYFKYALIIKLHTS